MALAAAFPLGCGVEDIDPAELEGVEEPAAELEEAASFAESEQGLLACANPDGTNAAMAAFAVAVAQELKRWDVGRDFVLNSTSGFSESSFGWQQAIKLASGSDSFGPRGKSRCADGRCAGVQAILGEDRRANIGLALRRRDGEASRRAQWVADVVVGTVAGRTRGQPRREERELEEAHTTTWCKAQAANSWTTRGNEGVTGSSPSM